MQHAAARWQFSHAHCDQVNWREASQMTLTVVRPVKHHTLSNGIIIYWYMRAAAKWQFRPATHTVTKWIEEKLHRWHLKPFVHLTSFIVLWTSELKISFMRFKHHTMLNRIITSWYIHTVNKWIIEKLYRQVWHFNKLPSNYFLLILWHIFSFVIALFLLFRYNIKRISKSFSHSHVHNWHWSHP